ncbi:hypothetical protein GPAL_1292 [Glaciecola pallidula DSM 14239 = ACAM 615]|uniref:Uncharacterized protein n=1 Tax=Brumicola pallidula DSM 14239 = ACAM 615 TaxID=1121922 RepID=K6ZXX2_9ALTE|nr:hypothetical protein GPAL_1292 [Glaciecola pallidula DSM 14239 = ACAM 615]
MFCCANTLIVCGAFTKAIEIWDGSKVSAVISIGRNQRVAVLNDWA